MMRQAHDVDDDLTPVLRRATRSARTRVLGAVVVLLVLSSVVSVLAIREILLARSDSRVDRALAQEEQEFRTLLAGDRAVQDVARLFDTYLERNVPGDGEAVYTFVDGRLYRSASTTLGGTVRVGDLPERWARLTRPDVGEAETSADGPVRYRAVPIMGDGRVRGAFVVVAALEVERRDIDEAVQIAALVLLSVLVVACALAWFAAGRVLAPLRLLSETARGITESDLGGRIPVGGHDEVGELARTFNAMLDRLERAFVSQRAFIRDASHELRTPITIVRGHLELLAYDDDPAERRETIALCTDELDRMNRFVDDLLLLMRAERADFLRSEPIELDDLADELLQKARGLGAREWTPSVAGPVGGAVVEGDRQRLTQAMMGLAKNAVEHTGEGDVIEIGVAVTRTSARLWVRDEGPGIAPEEQERIFERFARVGTDRRRSEGAGLGLAIVRAIAVAHGGTVGVQSAPGEGSTFSLELPLAAVGEPVVA